MMAELDRRKTKTRSRITNRGNRASENLREKHVKKRKRKKETNKIRAKSIK